MHPSSNQLPRNRSVSSQVHAAFFHPHQRNYRREATCWRLYAKIHGEPAERWARSAAALCAPVSHCVAGHGGMCASCCVFKCMSRVTTCMPRARVELSDFFAVCARNSREICGRPGYGGFSDVSCHVSDVWTSHICMLHLCRLYVCQICFLIRVCHGALRI